MADDLGSGIQAAREAIDSGAARETLERLVGLTGKLHDG
jgi:anthranilate phosphoribosyltransferase